MNPILQTILGPRVPATERAAHRGRYLLPTLLLIMATLVLLTSFFSPYWRMTLHAPQYPGGLHVQAYLNRLEGDVAEIDGLNHYIGMRPLEEAAQLERTLSLLAIAVMGLLVVAAVFVHSPWAALAAMPALLFPVIFLADLFFWLNNFGQNLDPTAALSSSIKPFTPPVLGEGYVGQFRTVAWPDTGLILASVASSLILVGLFFHRRAYKPLKTAHIAAERSDPTQAVAAESDKISA
ncbi:MAG: cytochrome C [Planctomycetota bacterium]